MNLKALPAMLSMVPSFFVGLGSRDLETIKAIIRKAYPTVRQLSTNTLAEWMRDPNESLLLVDVRSPEEFAVSHLRGAINSGKTEAIAEAVRAKRPARTVLYCSVGFRSSRLAHALAESGVPGVLNLEGSIFQWANEGRTLFRGDEPTNKVHPYGKRWARLLTKGIAGEV